jgi:hypothetical protein
MTSLAWQTYSRVAEKFEVRSTVSDPQWRSDLVLGSGLTALAVEAALRDLSVHNDNSPFWTVRDPAFLDRLNPEPSSGGVLGCSFSGESSEVLDGLKWLRNKGISSGLHSSSIASSNQLRIPSELVERPFQHLAFCATIPMLTNSSILPAQIEAPLITPFLKEVAASGKILLIVTGFDDWFGRVVLSYWLEYMHCPGFILHYPQFTHDFLWALTRTYGSGFAFILERPKQDLSDHRFAKLNSLLHDMRVPILQLECFGGLRAGEHVGSLLTITDLMYELAVSEKSDLSREFSFDSWRT